MSILVWIAVGGLGGAGALLRFRLDAAVECRVEPRFPLGTLVVNSSGSFGLGLLTGLSVTGNEVLLLGTGLLGSFTTFSTWMLETERLAEDGEARFAGANVAVSLAAGLAAAAIGWSFGALA